MTLEFDRLLALFLGGTIALAPLWGRHPAFLALFSLFALLLFLARPVGSRFHALFGCWILGVAGTLLYSINRTHTLGALALLGAGYLAFLLASSLPRERVADAVLLAGALIELSAILLFVSDTLHVARPLWGGPFFRTNDLAGFLILVIPVALARRGLFPSLVASVGIAEWISTQSRAGWMAGGLALLLFCFLQRKALHPKGLVLTLAGALVCALLFTQGSNLAGRLASISPDKLQKPTENSLVWRQNLWQNATKGALEHPLLGTGYGTFQDALPRYQDRAGYFARDAHNHFLQLWGETGWLAGAFLLLFAWLAWLGWKEQEHPLAAGLLAGILGSAAHACFDIDWSVPGIVLPFWVLAGGLVPRSFDKKWRRLFIPALFPLFFGLLSALTPHHPLLADRIFPWSGETKALLALQTRSPSLAEKAIELEPWNGNHRALLANLTEDRNKACQALRKAIELNPYRNPGYYRMLADRLPPKDAIPVLEAGLSRFPPEKLPSYEAYSPAFRPGVLSLALALQARYREVGDHANARKLDSIVASLTGDNWAPFFDPELKTPWKTLETFWGSLHSPDRLAKLGKVLFPAPAPEALAYLGAMKAPIGSLEIRDVRAEGNEAVIFYRIGSREFQNSFLLRNDGWHLRFP